MALLGVVWATGAAAMAVGGVRGVRTRVQAAADLAALAAAGTVGGEAARCGRARHVAAESGGRLASCAVRSGIADVAVTARLRVPLGLGDHVIIVRARAGPSGSEGVP